jgi:hypothetical protein
MGLTQSHSYRSDSTNEASTYQILRSARRIRTRRSSRCRPSRNRYGRTSASDNARRVDYGSERPTKLYSLNPYLSPRTRPLGSVSHCHQSEIDVLSRSKTCMWIVCVCVGDHISNCEVDGLDVDVMLENYVRCLDAM